MPTRNCPVCGTPILDDAVQGLCPRCVMQQGLVGGARSPEQTPTVVPSRFEPPSPEELSGLFPQLDIIETIGFGGMGAVYKARQKKLDRTVALKIIRPETAQDPSFAERFNREARTLARLNHANIVGVHDFGEVEHPRGGGMLYYFLMEYVDGTSLRRVLDSGGVGASQALAIVPRICAALQYAHEQGVVHRDIKPDNILLDRQGEVKIADFGLAKLGDDAGEVTLTGTHQVLGTIRYMAPEQIAASANVDHRADIYSLGVVFYEMLTGEIPAGAFEPPSKRADVDARLDEIVMRALASDPDRRYQSVSEIGSHVSDMSSGAPIDESLSHARPLPGPSTIIENGVAAAAAGLNRMFGAAKATSDHREQSPQPEQPASHQTYVSIPRQQIEADELPDCCMVCGQKTTGRRLEIFNHLSEWASIVVFLLFCVLPVVGIVAYVVLAKKLRVACPVCPRHTSHWSCLRWFAGTGWILTVACAMTAIFGGKEIFHVSGNGHAVVIIVGSLIGGALYIVPLVLLANSRVALESLDDSQATFKRVSSNFARAVRESTTV